MEKRSEKEAREGVEEEEEEEGRAGKLISACQSSHGAKVRAGDAHLEFTSCTVFRSLPLSH